MRSAKGLPGPGKKKSGILEKQKKRLWKTLQLDNPSPPSNKMRHKNSLGGPAGMHSTLRKKEEFPGKKKRRKKKKVQQIEIQSLNKNTERKERGRTKKESKRNVR